MKFNFHNLDEKIRQFMLQEFETDLSEGKLYLSPRLTSAGQANYPVLFRQAILSHDEEWLASQMRAQGMLHTEEQRKKPSGGYTTAKVPVTAATTLAEGEFNRFYCRAVCRQAIEQNLTDVLVYRARESANPRPDSDAKIGTRVSVQQLLTDLRTHQGVEPALGLPPGPNSGLSVRLP